MYACMYHFIVQSLLVFLDREYPWLSVDVLFTFHFEIYWAERCLELSPCPETFKLLHVLTTWLNLTSVEEV